MKIKLISLLVLFLMSLHLAYAELEVDLQIHDNSVPHNHEANFTLLVENKGEEAHRLHYTFPDKSSWSTITTPIITKRTVEAGDTLETYVRITPVDPRLTPGRYNMPYRVESTKTGEVIEGVFPIFLSSGSMRAEYVPVVNVDIELPQEMKPTDEGELSIFLSNQNHLNISEYVLNVKSKENPDNNKEFRVPLGPNENKEVSLVLNYPDSMSPRKDLIRIEKSIPARNRTYSAIERELQILGYVDVNIESDTKKAFLRERETISISNQGNIKTTEELTRPSSLFASFFTSAEPDYDLKRIDGHRYIVWDIQLEPGETKSVEFTLNYRPLFIIILLVIVGLVFYYLERSPVTIKKEIKKIPGREGETSRIKVLLHVKNRTSIPQENIKVIDTVSKIAQMETEYAVGTMHPSKVMNHQKKGTIVKWDIPVLEAFEERIITYQMFSKIEIIGPMKLAKAIVKFKNRRGKTSRTYSNQVHST